MFESFSIVVFLGTAIRLAVPLVIAALGESITERSGVLNIGIEGSIIAGALCASLAALEWSSIFLGMVFGAIGGGLVAMVFAVFVLGLNADQIIAGTATTMAGLGFTGAIYQARFAATGSVITLPVLRSFEIPYLGEVPILGPIFFQQSITVYFVYLLVPTLWYFLFRTSWGLELRSVGEDPAVAEESGISILFVRFLAIMFGGLLAGLAGAHLALDSGTFIENMSGGRGFIAIAIVVLGRWNPVSIAGAAIFFGAASALQFLFQSSGSDLPFPLFLMLPYLLTLIALSGWFGRTKAPRSLALPWPSKSR
ncbi:MAG TPA: ABC transporter permease [Gemmatimonadetes bacterium]|jgi:simple sugar transport system permease protein|nr:ABC transporter permease [Gemmatimonadota bacterium]